MYFIMYILVGLVSGWVATEVSSVDHPHQYFTNAVIGTIGSLLGGYVFEIIGLANYNIWEATGTAMVGATLFLFIVKLFSGPPRRKSSV